MVTPERTPARQRATRAKGLAGRRATGSPAETQEPRTSLALSREVFISPPPAGAGAATSLRLFPRMGRRGNLFLSSKQQVASSKMIDRQLLVACSLLLRRGFVDAVNKPLGRFAGPRNTPGSFSKRVAAISGEGTGGRRRGNLQRATDLEPGRVRQPDGKLFLCVR